MRNVGAARTVSVLPSIVPTSRSISSTSFRFTCELFASRNAMRSERYISPQCSSWLLPSWMYGLSAGFVFQLTRYPWVGLTERSDRLKGT